MIWVNYLLPERWGIMVVIVKLNETETVSDGRVRGRRAECSK